MKGRNWINCFIEVIENATTETQLSDGKYTEFMGGVLDQVGEKLNCYVVRKRSEESGDESGEFLTIDAMFIDNVEYEHGVKGKRDEDVFALPRAVVELENSPKFEKVAYCLWKLLCIRSPIRVLACYQKGERYISDLVKYLQDAIWERGLMKDDSGDLLVIIGNESAPEDYKWEEYFSVYEWRRDSLEKIENLNWGD